MNPYLSPLIKKSVWRAHPWRLGAGVVLLLILLVLGWRALSDGADKPNYTTEPVKRGDIENLVTAIGSLQPRDYVDVGAQVSGQLKKLHVDVGSKVKKGDLLAEIDATVYAAKVDGSRAQLANLKAQLTDRQAQLQLAKIQYQRQQNLAKEDATTAESIQVAEASLKSAEAQLKALQAQIAQNESSLRVEAANLDYANIYAPMDGTVVTLDARQGQTLNTNQVAPTIMRVADLSVMTVKTQVSEADVSKLKLGMEVYFTTLGGQDQRWYSKLDSIQPTPEVVNNVVLYDALFDVPNPDGLLMSQMSTQVFFIQSQAKNALLVPMSAVHFAYQGQGSMGHPGKEHAGKNWGKKDKNDSQSADVNKVDASEESAANPDERKPEGEGRQRPDSNGAHLRHATVMVMNAKGEVEERQVLVGVTNRVQAEIVKGLEENELVVSAVQFASKASKDESGGWRGPRMFR